ncbi:MAG: ATP synthase F1 subunit epsilon [Verrucomicrobiae bacterium]|nr:ATP synthase F1 subunit epsilon [Verrucomicrobiae bacterium]
MALTLKLQVITPEALVFSDDVSMVVLPGTAGEMGVLPGHEPLMTTIEAGDLVITKGGEEMDLAVGAGFAQITGDHVCVLTDMAIEADKIDEAAAEAARKRAEQSLSEKLTAEQQAAVEASLRKATAQLAVKRRHRERHHHGGSKHQ